MKKSILILFLFLPLLAASCGDKSSGVTSENNDGEIQPEVVVTTNEEPQLAPEVQMAQVSEPEPEPKPAAQVARASEPAPVPTAGSAPEPAEEPISKPAPESAPVDPVPATEQSTQTAGAPVARKGPPRGTTTQEERILRSDLIARVRLESVVASYRSYDSVIFDGQTFYRGFAHFTFEVKEVLHGSASGSIVVQSLIWRYPPDIGNPRLTTSAAATAAVQNWIDNQRDSQYDSRDAIVFLRTIANSADNDAYDGTPSTVGYAFTGMYDWVDGMIGGPGKLDFVTVGSAENKVWLPASTASTTESFLLDAPTTSAPNPPTTSLADLKALIAKELATVTNNVEGHKECLLKRHWMERERVAQEWSASVTAPTQEAGLSGRPANAVLIPVIYAHETIQGYGVHRQYSSYTVTGTDANRFTFSVKDEDTDPKNGYLIEVQQNRPLPKGDYQVNALLHHGDLKTCGYTLPETIVYTFRLIASNGVLHELFFDPVTAGSTVAADGTNGVLKPAAFTDANGASATIGSISYEAGTVKMTLSPHTALDDHILDIIELDGTVSLSLDDVDATVDDANDTLSWSVSSQPWEDGDLLMVRIREAPLSCRSRSVVPDAGNETALVSDCEALLNLRDELAGTAALNWSLDTTITSWGGVTVGGTPRRVTELDLESRSLTGVVPASLGDLTGLERLALVHNQLSGAIPARLSELVELTHLDLSFNFLSGPIPSELGRLSKLTVLWLHFNADLTGEIPPELGSLSKLEGLTLSDNALTGTIPIALGRHILGQGQQYP